ncbi:HAMP domain-containing protein [Sphingomonas naasensis]|uniref:histidine kinase n=1 Tax=Sphingomonas naasensis TaxID=1344951 RepID=A0A4S1WQQ0_9SPHN|nr:ATP-binding protein [Sphingomonas naasensis]TGX45679.1 HAMP domain-containing protein [Sphingomonas naasensis]
MDAVTEQIAEAAPRKRRFGVTPAVEAAVLIVAICAAVVTWLIVQRTDAMGRLLSPVAGVLLLFANLVPLVALIVLAGRRIARRRAARSAAGGGGRLHVRLVAMFSLIASVPIVLTVIAASVMFQSGTQFWLSDRAQTAFNASLKLAQEGQNLVAQRWAGEANAITVDLAREYPRIPARSPEFQAFLDQQTYYRNLEQSALFIYEPGQQIQVLYSFNPPPEATLTRRVNPKLLDALKPGRFPYVDRDSQAIWVITQVAGTDNLYLYAATSVNVEFLNRQVTSADAINREYASIQQRALSLQLKFNIALFVVALLIVGLTMFAALAFADRLVRPINQLVGAARRVAGGDFTARVSITKTQDEIGTLGVAFNGMTERLQEQTSELVSANAQLESRRALIEAVMSGVSAGVISIGADRVVRLTNASAMALLRRSEEESVGKPLAAIAPELDALLDGAEREAVVQVTVGGEARTLAVKITSDEAGQVLTFDDITQQLLDQRRAAWSDVARRIAHEIKNPLTPIQLAAERLKRRYGKQIEGGDGVFSQLTDTIVRQVGDLRRMVDEFSSFARMPKPLFRRESLLDIARQSMFLHEVAHPTIRFELSAPDEPPSLVCDRRQMGQALTNVIKNAVEAIEGRGEGEALPQGEVGLTITAGDATRILLTVSDNGVGLPVERDRIVEPYMTTRSRGTGLGLAIVKKIVEEHCGTISFTDREGGGTVVSIAFDTEALERLAQQHSDAEPAEPKAPALTRSGKS